MQAANVKTPFIRTNFTFLSYFMLAYYAYLMAALGPLMPFLAAELRLTYTEQGAHFTAFAMGMVLAGLFTDRLTRLLGRRFIFWFGGIGIAAGCLILAAGAAGFVTVLACLMMGSLGGLLLITIQASLADIHGEQRAIALSESNIAASLSASLAPLLIGELQRAGFGWRTALVIIVILYGLVSAWFRSTSIQEPAQTNNIRTATSAKLPLRFWIYWIVIFFSVGSEWSMAYWGADFLQNVVQLPRADASSAMTFFFGAVVVGRIIGSRLTRMFSTQHILMGAMLLTVAGFPLFWLGQHPTINLVGLSLVGLGIANQFPLGLTLALGGLASESINTASARISLSSGLAILIVPQILGLIADTADIRTSYGVVFTLIVFAAVGTAIANHQNSAHQEAVTT